MCRNQSYLQINTTLNLLKNLQTAMTCQIPNNTFTFFEGNWILLFLWDVIYFKLIYWCHMIFWRISGHFDIFRDLDTITKSLKIFIQFFIGYPNVCMWCGVHTVIGSWLYELLMSLRTTLAVLIKIRLCVATLIRSHNFREQ